MDKGALQYTDYRETNSCEETFIIEKVTVKVQPGDTLHSLFAANLSTSDWTFAERLQYFYELNPHLKKQSMKIGEKVHIPIQKKKKAPC